MHRFRKWSDPKRSTISESVRSGAAFSRTSTHPSDSEPLPALPPVGDFRTSLILPDLSRRFTLLRAPSGNPVSLGDLKSRLREQRTRGAENHLSEEEMDSFLQTLGRLRSKPSTSSTSGDTIDSLAPESLRSTETTTSSVTPSPRSTKRYSNNMFGSGKFRDHTYLRSVAKERTGKGSAGRRSTNSSSPTTAGRLYKLSDTPIPEDAVQSDLEPSSHDSDTTPLASGVESSVSEFEQGILKTFQPGHVRRASLALEEVIREIEEEVGRDGDGDGDGDDKILIPRSPAPERASSIKRRSVDKPRPVPPSEPNIYETGTAVSPDPLMQVDAAEFRSTPSPYPRAETSPIPRRPGYIPGMPRPMTPREATFDPDDVSPSSSSTPRATSPRIPGTDRATSPTNTLRRDSVRQSHRTSSPLLANPGAPIASLLSGVNGRFTPDRSQTPDGPSVELGNPHDSSLLGRRRPVSPFSQGTYQSMTMSSRPTTPSNVTWKAPASPSSGNAGGHSRSGSAVGFSEIDFAMSGLPSQVRNGFDRPSRDDSHMSSNDLHELNRSGSLAGNRSLRSPPLPDSPVLEATQSNGSFSLSRRGQLSSIGSDIGSSPFGSAALRSSTPTQYPPRSSASPTLSEHDPGRSSRRGSRQATASPFTLNQSQTLVLSPLANSSRSSLESAGSSYHTWEADKQDRVLPIVAALEPQPPAWHDLSNPSSELSLGADRADRDVEEIVQQYSGLNKADFVAIQDRLVFAARLKAAVPESRERKNSLRKRRPSTSQSATDTIQQGSTLRPMSQDSALKANALLDSMVNSIQAPQTKTASTPIELRTETDAVASSATESETSSTTRRKNALAQVLFGSSDSERSLTTPSPPPTEEPTTGSALPPAERPSLIETSTSSRSLRETLSPSSPSANAVLTSSSSAMELLDEQQELVKEVQRKTEAAMADLNRAPTNSKVNDSSQRKRIEVGQISRPRLVSASTSVDTIPVRSPSAASGQLSSAQNQSTNSSKLGTRFKKFRGSLRAKPTFSGSDAEPSFANSDRSMAGTPDGLTLFSATEPGRPKAVIVTPPASAAANGPGLKSLVSRFLKPRSGDTPEPVRRKHLTASTTSLTTSPFSLQQSERLPATSVSPRPRQAVQSAPPDNKSFRPRTPVSPDPPSPVNPPLSAPYIPSSVPEASAARVIDEAALKQFIDAANHLGLDQEALTELLARSPSVGSRLTAQSAKHMSTTSSDRSARGKSEPPSEPMSLLTASSSPRRNRGQSPQRPSGEAIAKAPVRRPPARNAAAADSTNSAVVRRTLIFPSEAKQSLSDSGTGLRKSSSTRRRRSTSAASMHSIRPLHDRVPTPPPPKSPTSRRFSTEQSPPVPHIPHIPGSLLTPTEAVNAPQSAVAGPLEKSNSAYDSLYDMYAGDGKPAISVTADGQQLDTSSSNPSALHNMEPGTAVEVLELASGETIWSIVNGLRDDDDDESYYGNRASFVSEYSVRDEGVQVFFKEHRRTGSKDSQSSFLSRKSRKKATQGEKRPETKVFFSSSAQIGRLIDNLSHGAEAGSFNILPTAANGTPIQSDPAHWTVEERLEHMLNSLGTS